MFGFGRVRTHLGDVFMEKIRVSFGFGWILEKKKAEISNSGHFRGPTPRRRDPHPIV